MRFSGCAAAADASASLELRVTVPAVSSPRCVTPFTGPALPADHQTSMHFSMHSHTHATHAGKPVLSVLHATWTVQVLARGEKVLLVSVSCVLIVLYRTDVSPAAASLPTHGHRPAHARPQTSPLTPMATGTTFWRPLLALRRLDTLSCDTVTAHQDSMK